MLSSASPPCTSDLFPILVVQQAVLVKGGASILEGAEVALGLLLLLLLFQHHPAGGLLIAITTLIDGEGLLPQMLVHSANEGASGISGALKVQDCICIA